MKHINPDDPNRFEMTSFDYEKSFSQLATQLSPKEIDTHNLSDSISGDRLRISSFAVSMTIVLADNGEDGSQEGKHSTFATLLSASQDLCLFTSQIEIVGSTTSENSQIKQEECNIGKITKGSSLVLRPVHEVPMSNVKGKKDARRIVHRSFGNCYRISGKPLIIPNIVSLQLIGNKNNEFVNSVDIF